MPFFFLAVCFGPCFTNPAHAGGPGSLAPAGGFFAKPLNSLNNNFFFFSFALFSGCENLVSGRQYSRMKGDTDDHDFLQAHGRTRANECGTCDHHDASAINAVRATINL